MRIRILNFIWCGSGFGSRIFIWCGCKSGWGSMRLRIHNTALKHGIGSNILARYPILEFDVEFCSGKISEGWKRSWGWRRRGRRRSRRSRASPTLASHPSTGSSASDTVRRGDRGFLKSFSYYSWILSERYVNNVLGPESIWGGEKRLRPFSLTC